MHGGFNAEGRLQKPEGRFHGVDQRGAPLRAVEVARQGRQFHAEKVRFQLPGQGGGIEGVRGVECDVDPEHAMSGLRQTARDMVRALCEVVPTQDAEQDHVRQAGLAAVFRWQAERRRLQTRRAAFQFAWIAAERRRRGQQAARAAFHFVAAQDQRGFPGALSRGEQEQPPLFVVPRVGRTAYGRQHAARERDIHGINIFAAGDAGQVGGRRLANPVRGEWPRRQVAQVLTEGGQRLL